MSRRAATWIAWSMWTLCVALGARAALLDLYTPVVRHFVMWSGVALLVYSTLTRSAPLPGSKARGSSRWESFPKGSRSWTRRRRR